MHSKIYQITTIPLSKADYISEDDFCEHWFTNSVADWVNADVDRYEEIKNLRDWLTNMKVARFDIDKDYSSISFALLPGGKEAYFTDAYKEFVAARQKTMEMGLTEFANGDAFEESIRRMKQAYCETFQFYVSSELNTMPFDEFIRYAEIGCRYYIGGVLDYHF